MEQSADYRVEYFENERGNSPVREYVEKLSKKEQGKIIAIIDMLQQNRGHLFEPYSRHIRGRIWELRILSQGNYHRIFYFITTNKIIVLLYAFLKKTKKTKESAISKAEKNLELYLARKGI